MNYIQNVNVNLLIFDLFAIASGSVVFDTIAVFHKFPNFTI